MCGFINSPMGTARGHPNSKIKQSFQIHKQDKSLQVSPPDEFLADILLQASSFLLSALALMCCTWGFSYLYKNAWQYPGQAGRDAGQLTNEIWRIGKWSSVCNLTLLGKREQGVFKYQNLSS